MQGGECKEITLRRKHIFSKFCGSFCLSTNQYFSGYKEGNSHKILQPSFKRKNKKLIQAKYD